MPLLRNSPFNRKKTPRNLGLDVPLYYLELTGEVFTEYEEFCYRIIQCNSLVWTCAETGRTELTFSEAMESEADTKKMLACLAEVLKVPALYLASIAQSSDFQELVSDVYHFMKTRYFINEFVVPTTTEKWTRGKVTRVDKAVTVNGESAEKKSCKNDYTPSTSYIYEVTADVNGKSMKFNISGEKLKRPKAKFLSDSLSVFLKKNAVLDARGIWVIKGSVLQEYNIQFVKFCDIFCGDPPLFSGIEGKRNKNHSKTSKPKKGPNVEKRIPKNENGTVIHETSGSRTIKKMKPDKVKYKYEDIGRQTGQQNIEKYFIPTKKSSEVQHSQYEIESEEEKSDDFVTKPDSDVSIHEGCSEEESGISGDEIKVVWSSTVRPNRQIMDKLFKNESEDVIDFEERSIVVKQEKDDVRESKKKLLKKSHEFQTVERKVKEGQSRKRNLPKRKFSSSEDTELSGKSSSRKKLKQTHMFEQCSSAAGFHSVGNKKTTHKNGLKNDKGSSRRKQKLVGTLKPWVQTTKKDKAPASASKPPNCGSTPHSVKQKKRNWLEMQREIELKEKQRKQEERQRKKAKLEEDKLKFSKFMKEWKKHREDLLCEDLKPLPVPCEINCRIPNGLFGDFMMVLEFLNSFNAILKVKSFFPGGVTFEYLERALVETEIAGPLTDVIRVLLRAIFELQVAEEEKPENGVCIAVDLNLDNQFDQEYIMPQEAIPNSIVATGWCNIFKGVCLNDIPMDHNTISEVLRLHLLSSGGRMWDATSKWSNLHDYTNFDDPGLWFRAEKQSILLKLSHNHVCELLIGEKLEILCCLVNQVLTYATVRDKVEDLCEQTRLTKTAVRALQIAELKLQKEATAKRIQEKKETKLALANGSSYVQSEEAVQEKQKMEKEMNKLRVEMQKKSSRIPSLAFGSQLLPLGSDRAHRKFWLFSSLPGLFVEYNPFEIGPCLLQPTPQTLELSDTLTHVRKLFEEEGHNSSDKENDASDRDVSKPHALSVKKMLGEKNTVEILSTFGQEGEQIAGTENDNEEELLICTASDSCPVHCPTASTSHWSFFAKEEDVTALLGRLNERGVRESALRRTLKKEEQRILESVAQCPVHKLNPTKFEECEQRKSTRINGYKSETVQLKFPADTPVSYIMEWTIRDNILALENKITNGGVGSLKVKDRMAWRSAIENGHYNKQCENLVWGFSIDNRLEGTEEKKGEMSDGEGEMEEAEDEEIEMEECHKIGGNVTDDDDECRIIEEDNVMDEDDECLIIEEENVMDDAKRGRIEGDNIIEERGRIEGDNIIDEERRKIEENVMDERRVTIKDVTDHDECLIIEEENVMDDAERGRIEGDIIDERGRVEGDNIIDEHRKIEENVMDERRVTDDDECRIIEENVTDEDAERVRIEGDNVVCEDRRRIEGDNVTNEDRRRIGDNVRYADRRRIERENVTNKDVCRIGIGVRYEDRRRIGDNVRYEDRRRIEDDDVLYEDRRIIEGDNFTDEEQSRIEGGRVLYEDRRVIEGRDFVYEDENRLVMKGKDIIFEDRGRLLVGDKITYDQKRYIIKGLLTDEDSIIEGENVTDEEDSIIEGENVMDAQRRISEGDSVTDEDAERRTIEGDSVTYEDAERRIIKGESVTDDAERRIIEGDDAMDVEHHKIEGDVTDDECHIIEDGVADEAAQRRIIEGDNAMDEEQHKIEGDNVTDEDGEHRKIEDVTDEDDERRTMEGDNVMDEDDECYILERGNITDENEHTDCQSSHAARFLDAESTTYAGNIMVKQGEDIEDEYKVLKDNQSSTMVNQRADIDVDMEVCEVTEEEKVDNKNNSHMQQGCHTPERFEDPENDYDPDDDLNLCGDKEVSSKEMSSLTNIPPSCNPIVKDLASAILQLEQSLDPTCLQKPLAHRFPTMKICMKQWEISLMNTVNFSQLFIHHSALEKSINWSRSAFNAPCVVCRKRKLNHGKKMIFCEGCNKRYHIYCLKPKLKCVPEGNWSCPSCTSSENNGAGGGSTGGERKRKSCTNVDEDFLNERPLKIQKTDENKVCKKCGQDGLLIFCMICSMGYHSECTYPPVRSSRRLVNNWQCESCKTEIRTQPSDAVGFQWDSAAGYSDEVFEDSGDEDAKEPSEKCSVESADQSAEEYSDSDSVQILTRKRRGCASVARAKIASFTKKLMTNSWEDDSQGPHTSSVEEYSNTQDISSIRRSSRRVPFASGDLPLDNAILQDLLTEMLQHEDAWPFMRPVRKSQVPDYHSKIKRPMDLGTVKYKLNTAEYRTNRDFIKDVLLVFKNCSMYNDIETIEYQCGKNMSAFFEERSRELGLEWMSDGLEVE